MTDLYQQGDGVYSGAPSVNSVPITDEELTPARVRQYWDRSARSMRSERNQASVNEQFLRNRHWLHTNSATGRLEELPRNPERVRATIARIGPDSHRLLAKVTSRPLTFEVPPQTPDDQSIQASKVGEAALHQTSDEQSWEDVRFDHASVTWTAGVGGIALEWDDTVGVPIMQDPFTGREIKTGEPKLTVVSMHEMAFEPGVRDAEKSYWWIRGQALPPATVMTHYGLQKMPKADARAIDMIWRLAEGDTHEDTPLTMVFTYYERPHHGRPGKVCTVINEEIIQNEPWPFPFTDRLNIGLATVWPIHGRWYGHTPVSDAVPVQTAMNASWSSIIEHMKQAGNARLWIPEGSVDDVEDLSDLPGEAFEYNPINGERPRYETPPVMPDWWIRQPSMLGEAMDDILGQHDVSRGVAPAGVESGIALSVLSENDDTPVGRLGKTMAGMWGRIASMVLELYEANVLETRQSMIVQPQSKIPEVIRWNGETLAGHTRAIVPPDSMVPRGRNAQMAYAFQLHDRGLITDPIQLARVADLPNQSELLEGMSPDTARAMRENAEIAVGKARTIEGFDSHENHIAIHRDFMRSSRFENATPDIQEMVRWHVAGHEQYAAFQAAQLAQAAAISPMAAALPSEQVNPLSQEALAEAMLLSQMAPSSETMGAPGAPLASPAGQAAPPAPGGMPAGPPGAAGPPPEGGDPDMTPKAQMTQELIQQGPPQ